MKKVTIIGAGFGSLYAACFLAKKGYEVNVYEKNESGGGRSRVFEAEGFTFDMGPSWYWMPELIDSLFEELGEKRADYYQLTRLDPSYQVFWKNSPPTAVPAGMEALKTLFDSFEEDGGKKLAAFLAAAKQKYDIAVPEFLEKPGIKLSEVINFNVLSKALKMDVFKSVDKDVKKRFTSKEASEILNFPVLFLGEMPSRIPSLYTLMNYADMGLGTWYPDGGMGALAKALQQVAVKNGVKFHFNSNVGEFACENNRVTKIKVNEDWLEVDEIIAGADYNFVEQNLIPEKYRRYSKKYWDTRSLAPSCLIFYLGLNKKVAGLLHHNLFFDEELTAHGKEIYNQPQWPTKPLFYACVPSKTDNEVAPENMENIFVLIPIAPDLKDNQEMRDHYYDLVIKRMEHQTGESIAAHITYRRDFCIDDFKEDYNSFKGNAYGLANTLKQTANLKPKMKSKLDNVLFCGQLTVPGPGIPPALISGKVAAQQIMKKG
jgi:phytoene desaturase